MAGFACAGIVAAGIAQFTEADTDRDLHVGCNQLRSSTARARVMARINARRELPGAEAPEPGMRLASKHARLHTTVTVPQAAANRDRSGERKAEWPAVEVIATLITVALLAYFFCGAIAILFG